MSHWIGSGSFKILAVTGILVTNPVPSQSQPLAPPRLPRDNLMVYRGSDAEAKPVKSLDDWAKRRAEIIRGCATVIRGSAERRFAQVQGPRKMDRAGCVDAAQVPGGDGASRRRSLD